MVATAALAWAGCNDAHASMAASMLGFVSWGRGPGGFVRVDDGDGSGAGG